ncbi:collagen-like protein [Rhizophagus clarus]|nr:collagen-like protein [Rhizophagus clarus]
MQIYEPNSKGVIKGLRIRNDGEMPTPDNHNIIIKLLPTENIIPNDDILFIISKSIPFNSTYELENSTFKFSIKNNETGFENKLPLQIYDCFKFKATVTSIEHILPDFNNFENQRIMIQYPIQIGEYLSFRHPSKDEEKFSLFWKVKNISNIEFGNNSEVGRLIETSIIDDNTNDIIYTTEIDSLTKQNHSLLNTNVIINEKTLFHSYLRLGSTNFPKKLLPIQSYSFHLSPLSSNDDHKKLDLVFDLNVGRLILDNIQLNDFIQPGSFQLLLSTPETDQVGDVTIKGTLQYTNGWIIQINDTFSLDLTGWIYLYPGGKNYPSIGRINIEVSKDDTHLLYLIEKSILQSCEDQLYKVINNMETPAITNEYDRIYEFTLMDFDCIPEDNSGIYEPGSRIIIRNIKVKNTGGMPTPISHDVEVTVDLSKSTLISLPNNHKLKLPKPIEHSKQVELSSIKDDDDDHCLEFQINQQYSASKEKPLNLSDTINLKAIMFGINREIINFKFPKQLTIQYPIQICPDTKIRDFPYKDLTRISWKINNVSNIDFGSESNSKRIIKVLVKINDMTPNNSLKFKTGQTLTTFEEEITILNAKKSKEMYCELIRTLSREDPTIIEVNFSVILYLGSIENPDKGLDIEIRNNCIEVSPSYITNKNADFLLVVSPKTKKKNVDNWKNLCQQLELTMSLWDIKREGHFDLIESGVIEDISGKSIIILNDELDDDIEEKEIKQTLDYLDPFHFYQAVNNFNIKFFIAGAIIDDKRVENLFIPKEMMETSNDQPTSSIVSKIKSFVQQKGIIKHAAVMERDAVKQPIKSAKIENVQTRLRPSSFNLFASEDSYKEKKMKKLSKSLQKNHPGQRYVLVSMMGSDRSSDQVVLCKTASKTKLHLLYYNNSENITDYNESNKVGLLSCVTFTKKLENLQKLFVTSKDDSEILEIYKSLIEVDLTVELIGLSGIKETNKEITTDILLSHMELFNKFYEFIKDSKETDITAKSVDWMIGVFAKLKILLQYSGDSLIHINSASRIKQLKSILDGEYMRAFGRFTNQTNQSLQNILDGRIKFIKNSFKNEHKPAKPEKYAYFKYRMIGILRKNNLKSDFELFGDKTDFILSQSEYDNIHSTHEKTTGTIRRKKTIRQDQIKSLYIQNMFEDPSKPNNEPIGNN